MKSTLIKFPVVKLLVPTLTWMLGVQGFIHALIISGLAYYILLGMSTDTIA